MARSSSQAVSRCRLLVFAFGSLAAWLLGSTGLLENLAVAQESGARAAPQAAGSPAGQQGEVVIYPGASVPAGTYRYGPLDAGAEAYQYHEGRRQAEFGAQMKANRWAPLWSSGYYRPWAWGSGIYDPSAYDPRSIYYNPRPFGGFAIDGPEVDPFRLDAEAAGIGAFPYQAPQTVPQPSGHRIVPQGANSYRYEPVFEKPAVAAPAVVDAVPYAEPAAAPPPADGRRPAPSNGGYPLPDGPRIPYRPEEFPADGAPADNMPVEDQRGQRLPPAPLPAPVPFRRDVEAPQDELPRQPNGAAAQPRADAPALPPEHPQWAAAVEAFRTQRYADVVTLLEAFEFESGAAAGRADLLRSQAFFAQGKWNAAAENAYRAVNRLPAEAWGQIVGQLDRHYPQPEVYERQLRALETYVGEKPDQAPARFLLAWQYAHLGYAEEGRAQLKKALQLEPEDAVLQKVRQRWIPADAGQEPRPAGARDDQPANPAERANAREF